MLTFIETDEESGTYEVLTGKFIRTEPTPWGETVYVVRVGRRTYEVFDHQFVTE